MAVGARRESENRSFGGRQDLPPTIASLRSKRRFDLVQKMKHSRYRCRVQRSARFPSRRNSRAILRETCPRNNEYSVRDFPELGKRQFAVISLVRFRKTQATGHYRFHRPPCLPSAE